MNKVYALLISLLAASSSQALTVNAGDINGKTNLAGVSTVVVNGVSEEILVDSSGLSLYTFEVDAPGVSKCSGKCLREWPPLRVPADAQVAAPYAVIEGNDGQNQLTLNGLPLYHYDDDKQPGDAFGQYPEWDAVVVQ